MALRGYPNMLDRRRLAIVRFMLPALALAACSREPGANEATATSDIATAGDHNFALGGDEITPVPEDDDLLPPPTDGGNAAPPTPGATPAASNRQR